MSDGIQMVLQVRARNVDMPELIWMILCQDTACLGFCTFRIDDNDI